MSRTRLIISIVVVLILAALGYMGYQNYLAPVSATPTAEAQNSSAPDAPSVVSAEGKIIPAREATLAFRLAGRVAEVLVSEGEAVAEGAPLLRLESAELQAAVAQAEAGVAQATAAQAQADAAVLQAEAAVAVAQANLNQLLAGARPEEIAAAEAQVKAANSATWQAASQRDNVAKGATPDSIAAAQAQLAQAQAVQKEAQIAYDKIIENIKFLAGATEEQARFQLNAANESVTAAQAALDQVQAGASEETLNALSGAVGVAAYQRDAAKAQLALLQAGASPEQRDAAQAQVAQAEGALQAAQAGQEAAQAGWQAAQAALEAARAQLAQATLLAPFAGTIVKIDVEMGEMTAPGLPVLILADVSHWRMQTTDLAETDVVLVKPGQTASVTLDAFGEQTFGGTVTEIGALAEVSRGNTTYPVTIELDATDAALRWGMTAFVDIAVGP